MVDLGCGDGSVLVNIATTYENVQCYGVELDETLFEKAQLKCADIPNITLFNYNIPEFDIAVDVVFIFLSPSHIMQLKQFIMDLKDSTIISYTFKVPYLVPTEILNVENLNIYIYKV